MSTLKKIGRRLLLGWLILSMAILLVWAVVARPVVWQLFYYQVWLIGFGLPLWCCRRHITVMLREWKWPARLKFALLAYGMVLLEEIFAALFNHLTEGFRWELYLVRIGQFWALNLFAFTGLIAATGFLYQRVGYTRREIFVLVGLTGLYSEKVIYVLPTAPLFFALMAPAVFLTYGLILSPALMSVPSRGGERFSTPVRYALFFATWFALSVPCIFLLSVLRSRHPGYFPPTKFIP